MKTLSRLFPALFLVALLACFPLVVAAQEDGTGPAADAPVDAPAMMAPADDGSTPTDASAAPAAADDSAVPAPAVFVQLTDPPEQGVEVTLETTTITLQGLTLPGAVLSVDGDLVDVDDQGNFSTTVDLNEGANEIDLVASDQDGQTAETAVYVVRGA